MDIVLFPVKHSSSQHIEVFNTKNTIIKHFISYAILCKRLDYYEKKV
jgi:hypothetical protein